MMMFQSCYRIKATQITERPYLMEGELVVWCSQARDCGYDAGRIGVNDEQNNHASGNSE